MMKIARVLILVFSVNLAAVVNSSEINSTNISKDSIYDVDNENTNSSLVVKRLATDVDDELVPASNVKSQIAKIRGTNTQKAVAEFCPSLENADLLTDEEFFEHLVHPCRYDRIQRPKQYDENGNALPVNVFTRFFIYYLQNLDTHELQFAMQTLVQMRYVDPRLTFKDIAPGRKMPIKGEEDLRKKIWVPHVFFPNEKESKVLGTYTRHILTSISPDGTVIISSRLQATLYCPMDLRKFPFDQQECKASLECWMYNASQVQLHWEKKSPLTLGPDKILTEYVITTVFTNETMIDANEHDLRHGAFVGNYSSISFSFRAQRQGGFYILEYFLPSMMIVAISWVSFWLQADQTAPRAMLGATAMLSFITLSSAQNKILPKVSYIKASEIWSMGCTFFIFISLVEFAFVNTIWRRKKHVELKKVNATNILKHTLTAREIRMALGIDTSRSVHHKDIKTDVIKEEEGEEMRQRCDKRKSIDSFLKVSKLNGDSMGNSRRSSGISNCNENENDIIYNNRRNEEKNHHDAALSGILNTPEHPHADKHVHAKFADTVEDVDDEKFRHRKESKIHYVRRDSSGHLHRIIDDHRKKSIMLPIIFTEDDNGALQMEMDTNNVHLSNDNDSLEIVISDDSDNVKAENKGHHSIYDGWTTMSPQEISHWIDKRSRTFFPGAFLIFNMFYWTFVYLF